jgi:hypothetical protein
VTPSEALAAMLEDLGQLSVEQAMHAATAGQLAAAITDDDVPPYALAGLARELRARPAALLDAPSVSAGVTEDAWEQILATPDEPWRP